MNNNLSTVQTIYNCFMQGDVPGILAHLADEVVFFTEADPNHVPIGGQFHGKEGVVQFFTALGSTTQTTHFEPSNFREEDGKIVNNTQHDGVVTATGKPFSVHALFTWSFNDAGQVTDWKGAGDFSSMNAAFVG